MGKNQNPWSHRITIIFREIKIIFHPLGSLAGFSPRVIVLWQENVRGTRNVLAGDRYNVNININLKNTLSWLINEGSNAIFLIGQTVFSWILILNLFIVVDVVFKCLRQRSNWLNMFASSILHICVFLVSFGIIKHL
jgi:hypothetical protein